MALLTLVNLRGVRETGLAFAAPTYGFVAAVLVLVGLAKCASGCPHATVPEPRPRLICVAPRNWNRNHERPDGRRRRIVLWSQPRCKAAAITAPRLTHRASRF
jgi:hypothetical protein